MNNEELKEFFDKYSIIDLESFEVVFKYNNYNDIKNILEIARQVYIKKYIELIDKYNFVLGNMDFKISNIKEKNNLLSDKELEFLYKLTDSSLIYLSDINNIDFKNEILDIYILKNSIWNELNKRMNLKKDKSLIKNIKPIS